MRLITKNTGPAIAPCMVFLTIATVDHLVPEAGGKSQRLIGKKHQAICKGCLMTDPQGDHDHYMHDVKDLVTHLTTHVSRGDLTQAVADPAIATATAWFKVKV